MNSLHLEKTTLPGGANKQERHYLDFIISDQSLRKILGIENNNLITPFGWGDNKEYTIQLLQTITLRRKPDLETGRVMLYVCAECGDIGCGAITAVIKDRGDRIIWENFGYETASGIKEEYTTIQSIEIDRQSYFLAFSKLK